MIAPRAGNLQGKKRDALRDGLRSVLLLVGEVRVKRAEVAGMVAGGTVRPDEAEWSDETAVMTFLPLHMGVPTL